MKRTDFINLFNMHFDNKKMYETFKEPLYHFDIDIQTYNDQESIQNEIKSHLNSFIDILSLSTDNIINKFKIKIEYDHYFEEEEGSDCCRYNCKLNINHFYDQYILSSNCSLKSIVLYRIESEKNEGIYSTAFAETKNINQKQISPYEEPLLNSIFDNDMYSKDEEYKRKWYFAFKNIEQLQEWLSNDLEQKLIQYNLKIKKITVPESFIIHGENQTIFQKEHLVNEEIINYNALYEESKSVKFKMK